MDQFLTRHAGDFGGSLAAVSGTRGAMEKVIARDSRVAEHERVAASPLPEQLGLIDAVRAQGEVGEKRIEVLTRTAVLLEALPALERQWGPDGAYAVAARACLEQIGD